MCAAFRATDGLYNVSLGLYALPRRVYHATSLNFSRSHSEERLLVEAWCALSGVFLRHMLPSLAKEPGLLPVRW